jgi:hypothetical protein
VIRGTALVVGALAASLLLVGAYLAAGGSSYTPEHVQNPCHHRAWTNTGGLEQIAQQFSLSALEGAACELGVSREELAQALASSQARKRFMDRHDISDAELARAIRAGLVRAVNDAEQAGALSPLVAGPLRDTLRSIPLDQAIELVNNARAIFEGVQTFLGPAQGLLEQFLP